MVDGDHAVALDHFNHALDLYRQTEDRLGLSRTHLSLGLAHEKVEDHVQALEHYHRSLDHAQAVEQPEAIALTTHDLGDVERLCQRLVIIDKGIIVYDGALGLIRERFATERTIRMRFADAEIAEAAAKAASKNAGLKIRVDSSEVVIAFDQKTVDSAELLRALLSESNPLDLAIQDESIESLIKGIYASGENMQVAA